MQLSTTDHQVVRAAHGEHHSEVHSREEEYSCRPVEPSRPGPSHGVVSLPWVFDAICEVYDHPLLDLFDTRANAKLPLYVFPVLDPMVENEAAFQHLWDDFFVFISFFTLCNMNNNNEFMICS